MRGIFGFALAMPFLVLSCRAHVPATSEVKWAHTPAERSYGIITARLNALALGFKTDFASVAVCVQSSDSFGGAELLAETKLAYAAWLEASGQGSAEQWSRFDFQMRDHCDMSDRSFGSVVVIGDEPKITPDQKIDENFSRNTIRCEKNGPSAQCGTGMMTMGWGGPGTVSYSFVDPERWESISAQMPATVILSPYVQWHSLAPLLASTDLLSNYAELVAQSATVGYDTLVAFNHALTQTRLVVPEDTRIKQVIDDFAKGPAPSQVTTYVPIKAAFHVLLHEVGHQFGMDHADNPALDSETGTTGIAQLQGSSWVTAVSTMAYADEYGYLTEDDRAGVLDLAQKNRALLAIKRGP